MKKHLKILIPLILVLIVSVLGFQISRKSEQQKAQKEAIQTIPDFSFEGINQSSLQKNTPTIFIHFNSTCEHCQYEAQEIYKHKDLLANCQILMVSEETKENIEAFKNRYKPSEISNLKVLQSNFSKYFVGSGIPDIFIYDAKGNLKKRFRGETKIEAILGVSLRE
jgi:thiol-disulfide isomerase/thioredoxin